MNYSDSELLQLLSSSESNWIERKSNFNNSNKDKVSATVCAFANALADEKKAGVLFIGVSDKGEILGLPDTDAVKKGIDEIKSDGRVQPMPSIVTRSLSIGDKHVMAVIVQPSSLPPVRFKGQIYVRMSVSTREGNTQDEHVLNEKRRHKVGRSFDSEGIPSATLSDLNLRYFEESYLPTVIAREVLQTNGRSLDEKLITTRMATKSADDSFPTIAGILTLGHSPQDWLAGAYVQFVRYEGIEQGSTVSDQASIMGNLETVIRLTEEKIKAHNHVPLNISDQDKEVQLPEYPLAALQQLFRNAVLHRNYEGTNSPIRLYWFDDRIEISSPGGPFGLVTEANFGTPYATDYRNPVLAEVLHGLNYVQKFGYGIQNAKALLKANKNPELEFNVSPSLVIVTIRKRLT